MLERFSIKISLQKYIMLVHKSFIGAIKIFTIFDMLKVH